jgi:hypothetical protein
MAIKQSTLDKKWYYRIAKVVFVWIPPILVALAFFLVLYAGYSSSLPTDFVVMGGGLIVYYLLLTGVWRGFLYIAFGGLENDTKKKMAVAAPRSVSPATPSQTPVGPPTKGPVKAVIEAIISLFFIGLFGFLAWNMLGCAQGKYRGNGDVMCQSIYNFFNSSSQYVAPSGSRSGASRCLIPTGCGSLWRCDGTYSDTAGVQRSLHGCLPVSASEAGYSGWSGKCTRCP